MNQRITQSDVARVAGVHNTTVSLALRNSRLIPVPTRQRIQAIAQSMGYSPDPALRALVAYRNSLREKRPAETLAYVTNWETKWGWRCLPAHGRYFAAAQRKAAELGYQLEHLWFGEPGMNRRRLDRVFLHRGISGVLLASHRCASDELAAVDWSRLSTVKIGCFPPRPAVNQVRVDPHGILRLALRQVLAAGGRRIGLVLPHSWDEQADHAWSAAFHAEHYRCAVRDPLPVLYLEETPGAPLVQGRPAGDRSAVARWYRHHRPDVILGLSPEVLTHLRDCDLHVPSEVAYVDLFLEDTGSAIAGVRENCEKLGEIAVEQVVSQLEKNILGLPAVPTVTSIGGIWHDGASLPNRPLPDVAELEPADPVGLARNLVA